MYKITCQKYVSITFFFCKIDTCFVNMILYRQQLKALQAVITDDGDESVRTGKK